MEKPACIKTHMRNMLILPEMIGSVVGIHNGKAFNQVEIKVIALLICSVMIFLFCVLAGNGGALFRRVCNDL